MTRYTSATCAVRCSMTSCDLRKHVNTHINQCPICSRTFESLLVLSDHVNNEHVEALQGNRKKCPFCDMAFETLNELSIHCKEHRSYFCDICLYRFCFRTSASGTSLQ